MTLTKLTRTRMRELARQSRAEHIDSPGIDYPTPRTARVFCPLCENAVTIDRPSYQPVLAKDMDAAVIDHLSTVCVQALDADLREFAMAPLEVAH